MKRQQPERAGCILFFQRIRLHPETKHLPIFAIPNGGSRNIAEAANLKRMGVTAGVPDICCAIPQTVGYGTHLIHHGLWMEAKCGATQPTIQQLAMIDLLRKHGYEARVIHGTTPVDLANNLWDCLRRYLNLMND